MWMSEISKAVLKKQTKKTNMRPSFFYEHIQTRTVCFEEQAHKWDMTNNNNNSTVLQQYRECYKHVSS